MMGQSGPISPPRHLWRSRGAHRHLGQRQLATGEDFAYTFGKVGTHKFYCSIHPYMEATVTVAE